MAQCTADSDPSRVSPFFGDVQHVRQFGTILVTQNRYPPNAHLPVHAHERAYISFVVCGSYIEYFDRRPIRCAPGTLIFHPSGEEHSDRFQSQEAVLLGIELDEPEDSGQELFNSRHVMTGPETLIARQLTNELKRQCPVSNLVVESLAAELVSNCCHGMGRKGTPRWLGRTVEIAYELYACRISLRSVAAAAGVHPIHLARQFRSRMGCTFGEFVRRVRLARALEQLRHSSASIAEIAAATGFADQSHLTRLMTAMVGLPPAAYRRESRRYGGRDVIPTR